jgi:hypothetical protein
VNLTVTHGLEDVLAPEKPYQGDVLGSKDRTCGAERVIEEYSGQTLCLLCTKPPSHDDPRAEMGCRQTDPIHQAVERRHDGVNVTYTWRSDRV